MKFSLKKEYIRLILLILSLCSIILFSSHLGGLFGKVIPKPFSFREGATDYKTLKEIEDVELLPLLEKKKKFNQKVDEYQKAYLDLLNNMNSVSQAGDILGKNSDFLGQMVPIKEGGMVYVNEFGIPRDVKGTFGVSTFVECPDANRNSVPKENITYFSKHGADLEKEQSRCSSGYNILYDNGENKQVSWLDVYGYKHIYPDEIQNIVKKNESDFYTNSKIMKSGCASTPIRYLTKKEYWAIPTSETTPTFDLDTEICHISANSALSEKVQKVINLNNELIKISNELLKHTKTIESKNEINISPKIKQIKDEVWKTWNGSEGNNGLKSTRENLLKIIAANNLSKESYNESVLKVTASSNKIMMWLLTGITLGLIIIRGI